MDKNQGGLVLIAPRKIERYAFDQVRSSSSEIVTSKHHDREGNMYIQTEKQTNKLVLFHVGIVWAFYLRRLRGPRISMLPYQKRCESLGFLFSLSHIVLGCMSARLGQTWRVNSRGLMHRPTFVFAWARHSKGRFCLCDGLRTQNRTDISFHQ